MKTVCAYCGVGCKLEHKNDRLKGVKSYPVNRGMSCAKGLSQIETIASNRLSAVGIRANTEEPFASASYQEAIERIAAQIQASDPDRIGFYLSGQMLNEDYYVANKLAKGFVGTPHCDTNSRTCMASAVVGYKKAYGVDYVPVRMEEIDQANLLILIGANPAESHVVLFNRIKQAQKKGLKVVVIDPRMTLTAKIADLHLPLRAGSDIDLLNLLAKRLIEQERIDRDFLGAHASGVEELMAHLARLDGEALLRSTGLGQAAFDALVDLWSGSPRIITAWTMGVNQSSEGVEKNLAIHNLHILTGQLNRGGSGPFSLTGQPNAMGGREVGGLSTTLAVHLDYSETNCQKVSAFWDAPALPSQPGLTAFEMIEAAERGEIDLLIICHTDPVFHLPNRHRVEAALRNVPLVVEINAYEGSQSNAFAHIQIPVKAFGEKEGTQTNMDRTLTRAEAFIPREDLPQDWEVFADIGRALGYGEAFAFADAQAVFEEYQQMTRLSEKGHLDLYHADYDALNDTPYVWGEGLFAGNQFLTADGRAHLHCVESGDRSEKCDDGYPFTLLTGRIRDQWHSGTKTAQLQKLHRHKPLRFVEMAQDDAKRLGVVEGESVRIVSRRGEVRAEVVIAPIRPGTLFIPISHQEVNYLTDDTLDPLSKEPDYNHSAVRVEVI